MWYKHLFFLECEQPRSMESIDVKVRALLSAALWGCIAAHFAALPTQAQNPHPRRTDRRIFITPTASTWSYTAKDKFFSHPTVGYHFVDASDVIGDIHTFNIAEGFANRAEVGYTRSEHTDGNSPLFSDLWNFAGMNIFNGKVVAVKENQFGPWTPGLAAGFVVRTGDKFVSGAINQALTGTLKSYTNEDVYVAATKMWLHPPVLAARQSGMEGDQRFDLRHRGTGDSLRWPALRRAGHSSAPAVPHLPCARGRVHAGAAPGRQPSVRCCSLQAAALIFLQRWTTRSASRRRKILISHSTSESDT